MDVRIQLPVGDLPIFGDGETPWLQHHVERGEAVVHILDPAFSGIAQLGNQGTHGLREYGRQNSENRNSGSQYNAQPNCAIANVSGLLVFSHCACACRVKVPVYVPGGKVGSVPVLRLMLKFMVSA